MKESLHLLLLRVTVSQCPSEGEGQPVTTAGAHAGRLSAFRALAFSNHTTSRGRGSKDSRFTVGC